MEYTVVIPTNRSFEAIEPLLRSLAKQTLLPRQVVIVNDKSLWVTGYELGVMEYNNKVKAIFSDCKMTQLDIVDELSTEGFEAGKGASYVRNFGRKQVICERMMFVDDDNVIDEDTMLKIYNAEFTMQNAEGKGSIVVPMQGDGDSDQIRNAVADGFSFVLCRPRRVVKSYQGGVRSFEGDKRIVIANPDLLIWGLVRVWQSIITRLRLLRRESSHYIDRSSQGHNEPQGNRYIPITLASSNCLFGPTRVFEQYSFDEEVPIIYEDLVMTGQMSTSGVHLWYDTAVCIHHYHGHRSKLAELYINTPERAYYKAKHRIVLVHILAQKRWQLGLFYGFGLWGHTVWLILHIIRYAPISQRVGLVGAILRGSLDGIRKVWSMS